jgi:hypothetical protein
MSTDKQTTSADSFRRLHEGDLALVVRIIVGIYALFLVFNRPIPNLPFMLFIALLNLALYEIIATVLIWIPKLIVHAFKHD